MAAGLLMTAAFSASALATEGYLQNGIGAREKALAGAGVASSTDATAASLNPAGLVNVGTQINTSTSFLNLDGGYKSSGVGGITAGGSFRSESDWVVVPNFAANWRVNWGWVDAIAFTAYGNGGVDTHYGAITNPNPCPFPGLTGVFCGGPLGIKLEQSFFSIALAKQVAPGISVGIAPILARQTVKVEGVSLFQGLSSDPANFSNMGTDDSWGWGVRGGVEWKIARGITLGIAGNTQLEMSNFDRYRGLFAEHGGADIPATLQAGVAVDLRPDLTLMADYKRIWYGSIAALANTGVLAPPFGTGPQFGTDGGAGFGARDTDVIKIGLEWRQSPLLTLRAGYSYNSQPIPSHDADLNIVTLGVVQHHVTGGFKYQLAENFDVEFAAMYAPRNSVTGPELGFPTRTVEIDMREFEFTIGGVYRFGGERRLEPLK
jgi:long-chain fatty acid transport protein